MHSPMEKLREASKTATLQKSACTSLITAEHSWYCELTPRPRITRSPCSGTWPPQRSSPKIRSSPGASSGIGSKPPRWLCFGDSSSTVMMDADLHTVGCSSSGDFCASTNQESRPKNPPEHEDGAAGGARAASTVFGTLRLRDTGEFFESDSPLLLPLRLELSSVPVASFCAGRQSLGTVGARSSFGMYGDRNLGSSRRAVAWSGIGSSSRTHRVSLSFCSFVPCEADGCTKQG
mmetsp:Transcript_70118/g.164094  ORF Transcript_70118/g.164094 Transcript_70118/m.164094 type:complete len:234 (-) Transcript_70118:301-1002(-)